MTRLQLYTDGGLIGPNPSPQGGTWAWCIVEKVNFQEWEMVRKRSGIIRPADFGIDTISNNVAELSAIVFGLEHLVPSLTNIEWHTDSKVALCWMTGRNPKFKNVPDSLKKRAIAVRHRIVEAHLLSGHPTRKELARGQSVSGRPVSEWNCWCDRECSRLAFHQGTIKEGVGS